MTGKVFRESSNIYQDQAKVLFDYYKKAAEKIVSEERKIEADLKDLNNLSTTLNQKVETAKKMIIVGLVIAIACGIGGIFQPAIYLGTAGGIIFAIVKLLEKNKAAKEIIDNDNLINETQTKYKNIRRDYKVDKIGVAYVPVATRVPFDGKSILIDHTNEVDDTKFSLTVMNQPDEFQSSVGKITDSLDTVPVVESNVEAEEIDTSDYSVSLQNITLHDYLGNYDRQIRNISYLLNDSDEVSVDIPAVKVNSRYDQNIKEYATTKTSDRPVINVFDTEYQEKLEKLNSLNVLKNQSNDSENSNSATEMRKLMSKLAQSVQLMTKIKNSGSSKLINYTSNIFSKVLKAGYTQYSPALESEEINRVEEFDFDYKTSVNEYKPFNLKDSSVVKFDIFSDNWVAEDGSRTSIPFGMHQIDHDVINPIITSLMEENRVERLKIYNNIVDQKREYLDKWNSEVGEYYRDNRSAADKLIGEMREAYANYLSSYNMYQSLKNTTGSLKSSGNLSDSEVVEMDSEAEMIAGFELQTKSINEQKDKFSDFMDRIQDDINQSTNDFGHVKFYEAALRDKTSHDTAKAIREIQNLDPRRKQLVGVSPYLAKYAKLPPELNTSESMMNDIQIDLTRQVDSNLSELDAKYSVIDSTEQVENDSSGIIDNQVPEYHEQSNVDVVETVEITENNNPIEVSEHPEGNVPEMDDTHTPVDFSQSYAVEVETAEPTDNNGTVDNAEE